MALTDEGNTNMVMPVAPMGQYGNGGGGFGIGDGSNFWIIILFILLFGAGGLMGNNAYGNAGAVPYVYNATSGVDRAVQTGFDQAAVMGSMNNLHDAVNTGFSGVQQTLCNGFAGVNQGLATGFAGVNQAISGGFAQAEIANNTRQIANMQQQFNTQTAITGSMTNLSSQLANCCCENRLASANLANVIQTENCADRSAISDGIRDILTATNAQTQRILDQLCQDKIDAKNETIQALRDQLNMANLAASQTAQTARILSDNAAQTQQIENYIRPQINPAYVVPNPYASYNNGTSCGCGYTA